METMRFTQDIPVLGGHDVVVAGAGVAGVAAAVTARRAGRSVLLLEKSLTMGGLATSGLINLFVPMCNGRGVQIIKGGNEPAKLAIAFALTLDNGAKELWWLYKGQFAEPSVTGKTDADKIDYQTPTIEGTFIRRVYDDALAAVVETGVTGVGATVETEWFTEVYEEQKETA